MRKSNPNVYLGLVHWPVLNKSGEVVVTSVTNFDIHDIARVCRVYGVRRYFIINRLKEQLMFVSRVLEHWRVGMGAKLNTKRSNALKMVVTAEDLEQALKSFEQPPLVVATAARDLPGLRTYSFANLRTEIEKNSENRPIFLLFGTGFGLDEGLLRQCDGVLEPIKGSSADDYRHLSVRSAVSICLDRLLGAW